MLQAPIFVSPGAIPSVACLEWIVCKNQTVSREGRLSDSQEHRQGVFCRLGLELEAEEAEEEQDKMVPQRASTALHLHWYCSSAADPGAPRSFLTLPGCCGL